MVILSCFLCATELFKLEKQELRSFMSFSWRMRDMTVAPLPLLQEGVQVQPVLQQQMTLTLPVVRCKFLCTLSSVCLMLASSSWTWSYGGVNLCFTNLPPHIQRPKISFLIFHCCQKRSGRIYCLAGGCLIKSQKDLTLSTGEMIKSMLTKWFSKPIWNWNFGHLGCLILYLSNR